MVQQKNETEQKSISSGYGKVLETTEKSKTEIIEKNFPDEYILEFISRHHLNKLWDEFVYEKNHPKIPLSAGEVWAMINLAPEEQERILKEHEYS
ncbi:hypothetical protein IH785_17710 [candidate division KSB1 bacterium]|nr:hypothetical protein [candidate division KSB1 bacterium]